MNISKNSDCSVKNVNVESKISCFEERDFQQIETKKQTISIHEIYERFHLCTEIELKKKHIN